MLFSQPFNFNDVELHITLAQAHTNLIATVSSSLASSPLFTNLHNGIILPFWSVTHFIISTHSITSPSLPEPEPEPSSYAAGPMLTLIIFADTTSISTIVITLAGVLCNFPWHYYVLNNEGLVRVFAWDFQ